MARRVARAALPLLAAVAVGVVLAVAPVAVAGALGALALAAISARAPGLVAVVALLAILGTRTLEQLTQAPAAALVDEIAVIWAVLVLTYHRLRSGRALRAVPGWRWFATFLAIGVISSLWRGVPLHVMAQGAFLMSKGYLFAFAVAQLSIGPSDLRRVARIGGATIVVVLALGLVNLATPVAWHEFVSVTTAVEYRAAIPSLMGPFVHPSDFGRFLALAATAVFAYILTVRSGRSAWALFAASLVGCVLSFRRKSIVGAIFAISLVGLKARRAATVTAIAVLVPVLAVSLNDVVTATAQLTYAQYLERPEDAARTRLTIDSLDVAAGYFPLGAGFGRFGSAAAREHYSPEYIQRGYQSVHGLGEGDRGRFLTDTMWPAFVGETGYLGAAAMALALVAIYRRFAQTLTHPTGEHYRWLSLLGVGWSAEYALESLTVPVYVSPPMFALFFGLVGLHVANGAGSDRGRASTETAAPVGTLQGRTVTDGRADARPELGGTS